MARRTLTSEAFVLRTMRYGEADLILQLLTLEEGRLGAIAKGARKTRSRFGARLEPFGRIDVQLHIGRGDLATVTGVELLESFEAVRTDHRRVQRAHIAVETVLRLFVEHDPAPQAYEALWRFLEALEADRPDEAGASTDPLLLSFGLKALWVAGLLPHLTSCVMCERRDDLRGFSAARGGAVCSDCFEAARPLSPEAWAGMLALLRRPFAEARDVQLEPAVRREILAILGEIHAHHGGFQLRTLARA